jgi:hypothetical protein
MLEYIFVDPPASSIDGFSAEDFRQLLDLNLVAYFLTSKVTSESLVIFSL